MLLLGLSMVVPSHAPAAVASTPVFGDVIPVGDGYSMAIDPIAEVAYATTGRGQVAAIDYLGMALIEEFAFAGEVRVLELSEDGERLFVGSGGVGPETVVEFDVISKTEIRTFDISAQLGEGSIIDLKRAGPELYFTYWSSSIAETMMGRIDLVMGFDHSTPRPRLGIHVLGHGGDHVRRWQWHLAAG